MRRTTFRAPSFSNHGLTVSPLNSRPSAFSRSDTCPFVNAGSPSLSPAVPRPSLEEASTAARYEACLRGLAPGCPLSVLCSFSIALWGIRGQHRTAWRGDRHCPWGASFCQAEWLALFRPWHNGGPPITRRPACDAGGCLRSPSWLCHDGEAVKGLEFKKSQKQCRNNYRKISPNIGQNRGLLTHTFSTIRTRIFFLFFS